VIKKTVTEKDDDISLGTFHVLFAEGNDWFGFFGNQENQSIGGDDRSQH
jgi:hypothetical protein